MVFGPWAKTFVIPSHLVKKFNMHQQKKKSPALLNLVLVENATHSPGPSGAHHPKLLALVPCAEIPNPSQTAGYL